METTTKQLAQRLGVHSKTIRRRITKNLDFFNGLAGGPFPFGSADELPGPVVAYLERQEEATAPRPVKHFPTPKGGNGQSKALADYSGDADAAAGGVPIGGVYTFRKTAPAPAPKRTLATRNRETQANLFDNTVVLVVAALILILVDAVSFGWIAYNSYSAFYSVAVPIFALAGMATGYSAFKSIISYKGWEADSWMIGFGVFQCALHLCALQALGDYSFFVGKIVISVGLPIATVGLALAIKNGKDDNLDKIAGAGK